MAERILWITLSFLFLLSLPALAAAPESGCVSCHGDRERMKSLGAAELYLDPAQVDREVGMGGAPTCVDCHLGDASAETPLEAHRGLLRPILRVTGQGFAGEGMFRPPLGISPLVPSGSLPSTLSPEPGEKAKALGITRIDGPYWHDRDPETLAFSPDIARKTCGKCHAGEVEAYSNSGMGLVRFQRANRSFAEPLPGPHNCGAWFGNNFRRLGEETAAPFTTGQNAALDRACNTCHPGCNDCHYLPHQNKGRHLFGQPDRVSCYGGGRGTICHAGPMERRRGAGFMRDEYAFPSTLITGTHKEAGLQCLDCHSLAGHDSGYLSRPEARKACARCHGDIVKAVSQSYHANVDCASCHLDEIGGYQLTFWGPGKFAGVESPYAKHAGYFGTRYLPTLIRSPEGRWIPTKPYPMAVLNQEGSLPKSDLSFRAIPERTVPGRVSVGEPETITISRTAKQTNDALMVTGTREKNLPEGKNAILWIQMDKASHALSFPRPCKSCHASHAQETTSGFRYGDPRNVKEPFTGSYRVVADEQGLRFTELKHSEIKLQPGRKTADFFPIRLFPEAWNVTGVDFSIPFDEKKVEQAESERKDLLKAIEEGEKGAKNDAERQRWKRIRAVGFHNPEAARAMISEDKGGK